MAAIAKELEDVIEFKFKSTLETLSKGALYLRMLYNQVFPAHETNRSIRDTDQP